MSDLCSSSWDWDVVKGFQTPGASLCFCSTLTTAASRGVSFKSSFSATPATWAGTSPWRYPWKPVLLLHVSAGGSPLKTGTSTVPGLLTRSVPLELTVIMLSLIWMWPYIAAPQFSRESPGWAIEWLAQGHTARLDVAFSFLSFSFPLIAWAYKINDTTEGPGPAQSGFCHMGRGTLSSVIRGYNSLKRKMCKLALVPQAVTPNPLSQPLKEKVNKLP